MYTNKHGKPQMKIAMPNGILEGESIEAILKQYGLDCLRGANLHDGRQVTCLILSGDIRSGVSCDWANATKETDN